jgi:oligopeptide/dipeptide ABC transporter ATP-binding protein
MAGSGTAHLRPEEESLLRVENLVVEFPVGRSGLKVHAVSDVSLDVIEGETLGLVGESGCGKSTTGKAIMQLPPPKGGKVQFEGLDMTQLEGEELRRTRTRMKMIFQDPISSLNPRRRVEDIIAEGLRVSHQLHRSARGAPASLNAAAVLCYILGALVMIGGAIVFVAGFLNGSFGVIFATAIAFVAGLGLGLMWGALANGLKECDRTAWVGTLAFAGTFIVLQLIAGLLAGPIFLTGILVEIALIILLVLPSSRAAVPASYEGMDAAVDEMMVTVGLDPGLQRGRRPFQFSGGQCQRISIARAVVTDPRLIICDEPVSALDVSVQAQILNLLEDMKARYGLTLIFIAHDLAVVKNVSDRVIVMYLGKICEVGHPDAIFKQPAHPYTSALLAAIPVPDPDVRPDQRTQVGGEIPSPVAPPSGCRFRTRCPKAQDVCAQQEPVMAELRPGQFVACHFPLEPGETLPSRNGQSAVGGQ